MLFYKSESICDKKSRGSDKSCSKYGTCNECIACDSYCSWCHVGGMCTKFCEGEDGAACKSPDCAKKSEFICASTYTCIFWGCRKLHVLASDWRHVAW